MTSAPRALGTDPAATNDFTEGASASATQSYAWDDRARLPTAFGWAPVTKMLDGTYYIYIVADDGVTRLRMRSVEALRVRTHRALGGSVAADTVIRVNTAIWPRRIRIRSNSRWSTTTTTRKCACFTRLPASGFRRNGDGYLPDQTLELAGARRSSFRIACHGRILSSTLTWPHRVLTATKLCLRATTSSMR